MASAVVKPYQARGQLSPLGYMATCAECARVIGMNLLGQFIDHEDNAGFPCLGEGLTPEEALAAVRARGVFVPVLVNGTYACRSSRHHWLSAEDAAKCCNGFRRVIKRFLGEGAEREWSPCNHEPIHGAPCHCPRDLTGGAAVEPPALRACRCGGARCLTPATRNRAVQCKACGWSGCSGALDPLSEPVACPECGGSDIQEVQ